MVRVVTLGDGRQVRLCTYLAAWRACLRLPEGTYIGRGISGHGETAGEALRLLRDGLADRINRHDPDHGRGRKWSPDWQRAAMQTAARVNTRRLIVRTTEVPAEFRARLADRLSEVSEW